MKVKVDGMSEKPRSAEQAQYGVSSEAELESDVARQQEQEGDATTNGNVDPGPDQEFEGVERDTDSIVKPEPPPRVDSNQPESTRNQGVNVSSDPEPVSLFSQRVCPPKMPRKRHLVDYLGQEEEGTFMWDSQRAYLITCMGFINSLGCLLKASVGLVKHGGGVFFIAYVISMVAFGCPLVYLETTLGQYAVGGPLNAWKVIPLFTAA
ncbi:sodium-dependent acetylcholine transporter-like [Dreissena polymorpha]|uniref:sodium-dependent acetylcholine transporter-like n=1 Tax=Dreissena polymorpha TaxID=45954 RepID=UPI002263B097|nr:sodium-dependent acetylcholine transporter-like [Dreissena polymorpha]